MTKECPNLNGPGTRVMKPHHRVVPASSAAKRSRWNWDLSIGFYLGLGPWALVILIVAGCAVGPNYKRPPVSPPPNFRSATAAATTNSLADLPWWQMFQDDTLQGLIRAALTNSYDLRIAIARVEQARAITAQNRATFFPQFGYQGAISRGRNSFQNSLFFTGGNTTNFIAVAGNVSWEVDLWGRLRRLNESARAQYFASQEARRDVMTLVISEVAQAYFQLLALDQELQIAVNTTNSFGESLRIFSQRFQSGIVSTLETSAAEAALASAAASVPDLERQIVLQENQISYLVGLNPGPVPRHHTLLQQSLPPEVPAGLPSALLERRPDIREAEQSLRSANAQVGVAVANFFPQLSLTSLLGQVSPELSTFTAGAASAWNIGASLTGPIFQGGRLVGQYRQAQALRQQFQIQYQATLLTAFQEVSNALIARQKFAEVQIQQARAVTAYQTAVQVATQRYAQGLASYYEVLQEQQLLFPAQNSLTVTELNQRLALVQLYRALGGGWQVDLPPAEKRKP
ncbi:MAG: efflux system, outer rane lipoprotein NodT family [Pedosphaera sp.]|nr:efflux system, outer rane lipoprotein NodT family [Pedosphaera sp.]